MPKLWLKQDSVLLRARDVQTLVPGAVEVRAPAITHAAGHILVACDVRRAPENHNWEAVGGAMAADLPNPNSLVIVRDGKPELLRGGTAAPKTGYSDPSFISDGARVVLFHARSADVGFFGSQPWRTDSDRNTLHVDIGRSDDGGASWEFSTITGDVAAGYSGAFATSGHGIIVGNTWIQPAVARSNNGATHHITWWSTDRGETWHAGQACGQDCDESVVEYVGGVWAGDGRTGGGELVMSARSTSAYRSRELGRWWSTSRNLGRTWAEPQWMPDPPAAACNATLLQTPIGLLFIYAGDGRIGGNIAVYRDGTWENVATIAAGKPFGYADALWHNDHLHVIYESDGELRKAEFRVG